MSHKEVKFKGGSPSLGGKPVKKLRRGLLGEPKWCQKVGFGPERRCWGVFPMSVRIVASPLVTRVNSQKALLSWLAVGRSTWSWCGIWSQTLCFGAQRVCEVAALEGLQLSVADGFVDP